MNVALLQEIKAHILAEPDSFRMDTWSCGTAHCIAGWALLLNGFKIADPSLSAFHQRLEDGRAPSEVASELLGIQTDAHDWSDQSTRLFNAEEWPEELAERYDDTESRVEKAAIAAERIDRFIATDGQE